MHSDDKKGKLIVSHSDTETMQEIGTMVLPRRVNLLILFQSPGKTEQGRDLFLIHGQRESDYFCFFSTDNKQEIELGRSILSQFLLLRHHLHHIMGFQKSRHNHQSVLCKMIQRMHDIQVGRWCLCVENNAGEVRQKRQPKEDEIANHETYPCQLLIIEHE